MKQSESLLHRWSRLKLRQDGNAAPAQPVAALPAPEALDFDADFSPFMHPEVDAETRRNALRRLFMTDHYRATDGLDVYVEDYSRPEELPATMLSALDHAQALLAVPEEGSGVPEEHPEEA